MQVFLPYASFESTARVLDRARLGKQRVECKQILLANTGRSAGWVNHPVTRMWKGYEWELCVYAISICQEWIKRGYEDTLLQFFFDEIKKYPIYSFPWLGCTEFHTYYRRLLIHKSDEYIKHFGYLEPLEKFPYEQFPTRI